MTVTEMRLYEIADARGILTEWLDESEGEITPELEALLAELDGQEDTKIEKVALFIRERQAHAKAVKEERDRLDAIVKREEKAADSLKGYLKLQMEKIGKAKVNGLLVSVALQASPYAVMSTLTDDKMKELWLDDEPGITQSITYRIDRTVMLARFQEGKPLPAGVVVDRGTHIRIR